MRCLADCGFQPGHNGKIWCLALSPDGRTLATAGADGAAKMWDGNPPGDPLRLAEGDIVRLGFSPDGRTLLTYGLGPPPFVVRWDLPSGSLLDRKPLDVKTRFFPDAAFSNDAQWLAIRTLEEGVTLWNVATVCRERMLDPNPEEVKSTEFQPEGGLLRLADGGRFSLSELANGQVNSSPWDRLKSTAWKSPGQVIAVRHGGQFFRLDRSTGRSQTFSVTDLRCTRVLAISPDGSTLALQGPDGRTLQLWSVEILQPISELAVDADALRSVAFTPDGKTVACGGADRTVTLWDVATGKNLLTLDGPSSTIWYVGFSPDGRVLVTVSHPTGQAGPREVFLWRTAGYEAERAKSGLGADVRPSR